MKIKFCLLIFGFFILMKSDSSFASHIAGLNITYQYISGNDYLFKLTLYNDCGGISAPSSSSVCFSSISTQNQFYALLDMDSSTSGIEVPFNNCYGLGQTSCSGGTIVSFKEYNYFGIVTVPPASDWVVSYDICCRSGNTTNLINGAGYSLYSETTFDNLNFPANSSPQFTSVPVNYYCVGIPAIRDYSAFDVDGDSLVYEFIPVNDGTGCSGPAGNIPMAPPYTYDQPLTVANPLNFDLYSGMLQFTPSIAQVAAVAIQVKEYRNGVLIGTVHREDPIVSIGGIYNPDTISGRVYIDLNANGVFDISDVPCTGTVVQIDTGLVYSLTAGNGKYELFTDQGNYNISLSNHPIYTTVSPSSINITTTGGSAYPNNDFILEPVPNMNDLKINLNGSSFLVPGRTFPVTINYNNAGTTDQSNILITASLDSMIQFNSASPYPDSINGNQLIWNILTLNKYSGGIISISTTVDSTAIIGTSVNLSCNISSGANELTPINNYDSLSMEIRGPYDPNLKENTPSENITPSFINAQNPITYKIYFQNLGNAAAQNVRIVDLIDIDLDLSTIELIGFSFPCSVSLTNGNQIEFNFYGINLPPESLNEPGSHGFVEYRILPKSSLSVGALITNSAGIYFDFNPPIQTNLVANMVVLPTSVNDIPYSDMSLKLFPSPVKDELNIEFDLEQNQLYLVYEVYNLPGIEVMKNKVHAHKGRNILKLDVRNLSSGIYFLKLGNGNFYEVKKFVVIKD